MKEFLEEHKKQIIAVPLILLGVLLLYIIVEQSVFFAGSGKVDAFVRNYYKQVEAVDSRYSEDTEAQHKEKVDKLYRNVSGIASSKTDYNMLLSMPKDTKQKGGKLVSYNIDNLRFGALRKNPFKDTIDVTVFYCTDFKYQKSATIYTGTCFESADSKGAGVFSEGDTSCQIEYYKVAMKIKKIGGEYKIIAFTKNECSDKELD